MTDKNSSGEKLQKVLADQGLGSRREIERWISDGRLKVNGEVAHLGIRVLPEARIDLDGRRLRLDKPQKVNRPRVIAYHKPEGELCSRSDPEGRPTVFEQLPRLKQGRWIMIGRLDINTAGLLLFTTDGDLANRLMHPSSEIEREYAVRVLGEVEPQHLTNLKQGVQLDDGPACFNDIALKGGEGANTWYHVILKEGRNREVRRLWESQGLKVSRLTRVRFGCAVLPRRLPRGKWEYIEGRALDQLAELVGKTLPQMPAKRRTRK